MNHRVKNEFDPVQHIVKTFVDSRGNPDQQAIAAVEIKRAGGPDLGLLATVVLRDKDKLAELIRTFRRMHEGKQRLGGGYILPPDATDEFATAKFTTALQEVLMIMKVIEEDK